jgi:hypothetical protein
MNLANLLTVGIASLTAVAVAAGAAKQAALPNLKPQSPQTTPQPAVAQSTAAQQDAIAFGGASPIASLRRLTVTVKVQEP